MSQSIGGIPCSDPLNVSDSASSQTLANHSLGASGSYTIPAGKNYAVAFLSGTGTFNGATVSAGFSREGKTAANLVVTTDAASSAYIDTAS